MHFMRSLEYKDRNPATHGFQTLLSRLDQQFLHVWECSIGPRMAHGTQLFACNVAPSLILGAPPNNRAPIKRKLDVLTEGPTVLRVPRY